MTDLITTLRSGRALLMDGAMGTEIQRLTQSPTFVPGEPFNLTEPALVQSIHRAYLDAGADVLLTNTFQASPSAHALWQAALKLARAVQPRYVIADVGPIAKPTSDIARAIATECASADALLLETWTSLAALELFAAIGRPPLLVSFTYHRACGELTTIEGGCPEECAHAAVQAGAIAIGANCGKDIRMNDMIEIAARYRAACNLPIFVRPNAGTPTQSGSTWTYPHSPAVMAAGLPALLDAGVAMIGGCCGTTPAHIRAFRDVLENRSNENSGKFALE